MFHEPIIIIIELKFYIHVILNAYTYSQNSRNDSTSNKLSLKGRDAERKRGREGIAKTKKR